MVIAGVGALVVGVLGCGVACGVAPDDDERYCVDSDDHIIDNADCDDGDSDDTKSRSSHPGAHWLYGGTVSNGKVSGGSTVQRGGFGRLFGGSGS